MLKIRIVNLRQQDMSLINYLKKFQANKLVNKQIQGGLWEDTIITLAALKKIRAYTTIDTFKFESCRLFWNPKRGFVPVTFTFKACMAWSQMTA